MNKKPPADHFDFWTIVKIIGIVFLLYMVTHTINHVDEKLTLPIVTALKV